MLKLLDEKQETSPSNERQSGFSIVPKATYLSLSGFVITTVTLEQSPTFTPGKVILWGEPARSGDLQPPKFHNRLSQSGHDGNSKDQSHSVIRQKKWFPSTGSPEAGDEVQDAFNERKVK